MNPFTKRIWDLFRQPKPQAARSRRWRLELEALEDRSLPTGTASGALSGVAFVDANANGVFDAGEGVVPGVPVHLTGTTNQGSPVDVGTSTDAGGGYEFFNVLPGSYQINAGPGQGLLPGSADGRVTIAGIAIDGGQTVVHNLAFHGLAPEFVSLRQLLTSTTIDDFPFADPGSGEAPANVRENNLPSVKTAIADVSVVKNSADTVIDLAGHFSDRDFTNSQIRFRTSEGVINVELLDTQAPRTVANFFNYIQGDRFDNTIFHRLEKSPTLSVLQGGGFRFTENPSRLTDVAERTDRPVQNEFDGAARPNMRGTIAMAKPGTGPDTATHQFYFNLENNPGLDDPRNNGGFTVFGIVRLADEQVINTLARIQTQNQTRGDPNSPFANIPLKNYTGTNFPTDTTASNYALVSDVEVIQRDEFLSYAVVGNSNSSLVSATIAQNNRLVLNYAANATGTATITLRATDRFGATFDTSFKVTVSN